MEKRLVSVVIVLVLFVILFAIFGQNSKDSIIGSVVTEDSFVESMNEIYPSKLYFKYSGNSMCENVENFCISTNRIKNEDLYAELEFDNVNGDYDLCIYVSQLWHDEPNYVYVKKVDNADCSNIVDVYGSGIRVDIDKTSWKCVDVSSLIVDGKLSVRLFGPDLMQSRGAYSCFTTKEGEPYLRRR